MFLCDTFPGHISTSRIERLLQSFVETNSEVEDLSDCDVADPGVELSDSTNSTSQQSSDESAELQRSNEPLRKRKHGPSPEERKQRWKSVPFAPDLLPFEAEDESVHKRQHWQPLDYVEQYMDTELMKRIANCTNAMSLAKSGRSLNTTVDEIYNFFWCINFNVLRDLPSNQNVLVQYLTHSSHQEQNNTG